MAADLLNKMAAQKPDASVLPPKVKCPGPEDFKGCKCPTHKCTDGNCPCFRKQYFCTSKCECKNCWNFDLNEKAGDAKPAWRCACKSCRCCNKLCKCFKHSQGCSPMCGCKDCCNPIGVGGSEPKQAGGTSNMAREPPHMVTRGASQRSRTE